MPTIPLLDNPSPADVDAPRRILAPGGYEWWYFEAQDPVSDVRVTALLFNGNPFDPGYVRRYAWYRRFPTRLAPPVPAEHPGAFVRVYERGAFLAGAIRSYEPGACRAGDSGVTVGDSGFTRAPDGALRLTVRGLLDLTFQPRPAAPPPHLYRMADGVSVAEAHGWVVSRPACTVSGEVTVDGRSIRLDGSGYQDHNFGAEPVHLAARRWFWSCTWVNDRSYVAVEAVPTRGGSRGVHLLGSEMPGSAVWDGRTPLRIPYPTMIDFGHTLRLDEPRVIESLPVMVQLRYRAVIDGVTATAVAHVVEPARASWPGVSPLLGKLLLSRRRGRR